ncbi:MAG: efflux RND transporter periplasmic adaptor subunit [Pseudomonadota bacterium]
MGTKTSYLLAAMVAGGLGYWMYSGELIMGGQGDDPDSLPPLSERASAAADARMAVRVREVSASTRQNSLEVRGRAEAETRVEVRTETSGQVTQVLVQKGQRIAAGTDLCRIDEGVRDAQLRQAEAQLQQAQFDYDNNVTLAERGVVAEARVRTARAALNAAEAAVAQAKQEMTRVAVSAPIAGVVEDPLAEVGDFLSLGATCATIVQTDPMLAIGQVSEREIAQLGEGMPAIVTPLGGEPREGRMSYIAPTAESETRTFRVEVSVPNADGALRDGMTSAIEIPLPETRAHALTASTLTLNDDGVIGVRTVDGDDEVVFMPVDILADSREGVWVTGLPETVRVITVGQEYVAHGAKVRAMPDERGTADAAPEAAPEIVPDAPAAEVSQAEPIGAPETVEVEITKLPVEADAPADAPQPSVVPVNDIRTGDEARDITDQPATGDELTLAETPPAPPQRPDDGLVDVSLLTR